MYRSLYTKLHPEELYKKHIAMGAVGTSTFPSPFTGHIYESVRVLSQRVKKIIISEIRFNLYIQLPFFLTIFYSFILLTPYISTFYYLFSLFIHTLSGHSFVHIQYPSDPSIHFVFLFFILFFIFINLIPVYNFSHL